MNSSPPPANSANGDTTNNVVNGQDLNLNFLDKIRLAATRNAKEDEGEDLPTELNTINSAGGFLVVSPDKLSVKYTNTNLHGHDVGVVQANKPAPIKCLTYYFEIFVKDSGIKGQIAIGFTKESFKMRRQPGWEVNSCGYHGDDGFLYRGQGKGEPFGPKYTKDDTVGGGINYASQEFFFTKNGAIVGKIPKDIRGHLFPTVAVHSQNEEVLVNFGKKKFAFDIKGYEALERNKQQMAIEKLSTPPNIGYGLVKTYLLHYGYEETLNAFNLATQTTVPPIHIDQENAIDEDDSSYALKQRKNFRQLVRNGEIDTALAELRNLYPQIVQDDKSVVCFLLHCQKFIELVRVGKLEEGVKYGRLELAKFVGLTGFQDIVEDCFALLVYEKPEESSVGYFLEDSQRELVADAVNAAILSTNPNKKDVQRSCHLQSHLEKLLRQLTVCCLERRSLNGDQGETFRLHHVLNNNR
ncbi:LIS1 homology motif [Arabidopsis thaliana x Arabidopsis arenosa]|uniref:LIS1 homology motif n=2 Tax=Arabidopsis TaxID=3701 RepID=A0A8T2CG10_ARASU|nr:LIS1 homology motif [Arabidopsis thaliana x Arabidopsis arenosa]KAG7599308.1 LIS1 homology motif [Arabidopsis suecica]